MKKKYFKICPDCGSTEILAHVTGVGGGFTLRCSGCGKNSLIFPEIEENQIRAFQDQIKQKK